MLTVEALTRRGLAQRDRRGDASKPKGSPLHGLSTFCRRRRHLLRSLLLPGDRPYEAHMRQSDGQRRGPGLGTASPHCTAALSDQGCCVRRPGAVAVRVGQAASRRSAEPGGRLLLPRGRDELLSPPSSWRCLPRPPLPRDRLGGVEVFGGPGWATKDLGATRPCSATTAVCALLQSSGSGSRRCIAARPTMRDYPRTPERRARLRVLSDGAPGWQCTTPRIVRGHRGAGSHTPVGVASHRRTGLEGPSSGPFRPHDAPAEVGVGRAPRR